MLNCEQDNEGADPISYDEPATPEMFGEESFDTFAVCHDEVELMDEELEAIVANYNDIDFQIDPDALYPTDKELRELEKKLEEAA